MFNSNIEMLQNMTAEELTEFFTKIDNPEELQCKMCQYAAKSSDGVHIYQCCDEEGNCKEGIKEWLENA